MWEKFRRGVPSVGDERSHDVERLTQEYDEQIAAMGRAFSQAAWCVHPRGRRLADELALDARLKYAEEHLPLIRDLP